MSCTQNAKDKDVYAKVYDKSLLKSELQDIVPKNIKGKDSINIINSYVQAWIEKNVLLKSAESNLNENQKDFEKEIEDYKTSLLIYNYEKEFVNQKLDTIISDKEIENYYQAHQNDFQLKENICKVWYAKIRVGASGLNEFKRMFGQNTSKAKIYVENYCRKNAINFFLDDEKWLFFNDLKKEIPLEYYNEELFLQNNKQVELKQKEYIYFVSFKGFKIKDGISPLSFETSRIKSIILNKRKVKLIGQLKKDLINKATENNEVKIYNEK